MDAEDGLDGSESLMNHQHHADVEEMVQTRGGLACSFRKGERKKNAEQKKVSGRKTTAMSCRKWTSSSSSSSSKSKCYISFGI